MDTRPSIAVLTFENRSAKPDDVYFVDGIHDDILTQLSKVSGLKVISRTSVEQFRDTRLPTGTIAEQLGATQLLEGAVQRADRVRINVQLIDAATDAHLWAESYDRELTAAGIFTIQTEVAAAIAEALRATLSPAERARVNTIPTRNLDAWEAFQLARQRMANRSSVGLAQAETLMLKAIDLDPDFALAHVGLADVLMLRQMYAGLPRDPGLDRVDAIIGRALQLDPDVAEAWALSAMVHADRGQVGRAEQLFLRAISLNPNHATTSQWFSDMLGQWVDTTSRFSARNGLWHWIHCPPTACSPADWPNADAVRAALPYELGQPRRSGRKPQRRFRKSLSRRRPSECGLGA